VKVVYLKLLDLKPLYVGEGSTSRALDPDRNNKVYKDKLKKHKNKHVCSLILSKHSDKVGAVLQEQGFISWFGRLVTNDGPLTNCLPYGDTSFGSYKPLSPENYDPERERLRSLRVSQTRLQKIEDGTLLSGNWWNNGTKQTRSVDCPGPGWVRGQFDLTDEHKQKLRDSKLGRRWWTNGKDTKLQHEQPGPDWKPGRPGLRPKKRT
jgi:hypothetical protein